MRRSPLRRRNALALHELHYGPNMTPMVDVVMVILVFFMASASVLGPEWLLRTALPPQRRPAAAAAPDDLLRVTLALSRIQNSTQITLRRSDDPAGHTPRVVTALESDLAELARQRGPGQIAIIVMPQDDVAYEEVVRVHEYCAAAGLTKVGLGR